MTAIPVQPAPDQLLDAHLAACVAALADGVSLLHRYPLTPATLTTLECLALLGVPVDVVDTTVSIEGVARQPFAALEETLDCGDDFCTLACLLALLAGQPTRWELQAEAASDHQRVNWIMHPLRLMGAAIRHERHVIEVQGGALQGTLYRLPAPSELLKAVVLLAGLQARGQTAVVEPAPMGLRCEAVLEQFGIAVLRAGASVGVAGDAMPRAANLDLAADVFS